MCTCTHWKSTDQHVYVTSVLLSLTTTALNTFKDLPHNTNTDSHLRTNSFLKYQLPDTCSPNNMHKIIITIIIMENSSVF